MIKSYTDTQRKREKIFSKENYVIKHYPDKIRQIININLLEDQILKYQDYARDCLIYGNLQGALAYTRLRADLEKILEDMVK